MRIRIGSSSHFQRQMFPFACAGTLVRVKCPTTPVVNEDWPAAASERDFPFHLHCLPVDFRADSLS